MQSLSELPLIAGNLALDFVNTAELRGDPAAGDVLRAPADLVDWGRRYRLLNAAAADADDDELRAALATRELLYRLFVAHVHGDAPAERDLAQLAAAVAQAHAAARLVSAAQRRVRWEWDPTAPATVRHAAAVTAAELLRAGPLDRLKQCPGEHCGWLFLDATKRGNRRWCSMAECGQQAKSARAAGSGARRPGAGNDSGSRRR